MLTTKDFHNFLEMIPQILLASIINTLLLKTNLLLQILYALPFEYVFHSDCSKLFFTNSMNTLIQVSKLHIIHSHNITLFHLLKNGFPISYIYCVECQRNKHFNMKIQTTPTQSFSEHAPSFNYRISMDTKGPINPPSHNKAYIHVIIDAFSHVVVTVPIKSNNAKTAIKTLLHHWIIKFGPPIYLFTDRGSEYVNKEMAHLCTLMGIRHSPRTAYSPRTNGLVEVQNRNLGTHL